MAMNREELYQSGENTAIVWEAHAEFCRYCDCCLCDIALCIITKFKKLYSVPSLQNQCHNQCGIGNDGVTT